MRIGIAQINTVPGAFGQTVERMVAQSQRAAEQQVELLVFPLAALAGTEPVPFADRPAFMHDVADALATLAEVLAAAGTKVDVIVAAATKKLLLARRRAEAVASQVLIATDDGSEGDHGFASVPLERLLEKGRRYEYAAVCGPTPMMRACAKPLVAAGIPTEVSMERLMACGVGACLSCIVPQRSGESLRACVDGPVMDASEVAWDEL